MSKRTVELAIAVLSCLAVGIIVLADDGIAGAGRVRTLDGQLVNLAPAGQDDTVLALRTAASQAARPTDLYVVLADPSLADKLVGRVGRLVRIRGVIGQLGGVRTIRIERLDELNGRSAASLVVSSPPADGQ